MIRIVKAITLPLTLLLLILAFTVGIAHSQTANGEYDADSDRLIEISNLEQLNAVRYDVNGDGRPDRDSDSLVYSLAFPVGGAEAVCDEGCHGYELAGPLDFGEAGSYASGAVRAGWSSGSGWEPIGVDTSGRMFSATFDGNGHTVSNLYIDRAIGSDRSSGVGLFGVAGGSSVIRGIGLVNAEVHGYYQVGGLVGKHSGTISDSYATGNVTGSDDDVGGLVGENNGQVSDSYAAGTVSGVADVGGLVGENSSQVSDSYATGGVTGSGNNVGGLVGRSAAPISDSYATGTVSGGADVGGLVGENSGQVSASYATGSVTGSGNNVGGLVGAAGSGVTFTASYATGSVTGSVGSVGGLVGNAGSGITVIAGYATGSVTASSNYVGGLVGFGPGATVIASYATGRVSGVSDVGGLFGYGSGTTFVASYWDTGTSGQRSGVRGENVAGAEGKTTAELQSPTGDTGIYVAWNTDLDNADVDGNPATGAEDYWDFGTSSQYPALKADIDGNGVATWQELGGQGRVPPPTPPLLPTPPPTVNGKYDGDGDRLIEVSNLEQLNAVRYDVNGDGRPDRDSDSLVYSLAFPVGGAEAVCDKRCHGYELAGPLDFGEAGSYASGAVRAGWSSGSGWEPIGVDTSGRMFSATFDGNGHTVSNLYIDRAIGSDRSSGVGLFGVAGGSSVIRGIGLVNAEVHGYYQVGGLVGKHSGTISDSYATGNVTGSDDDVGGLVGENNGQVSDSYAAGTVSGVADVGGLVGENSSQVSDSYATGGVTGSGNNVGGLVGRSAAPISDSYATGTVSGGADVGGLVGENSGQVSASYATGSVTGSGNNVGGLVGAAGSGVTFTASYATGSVTGSVGSVGGLVGNAGSGITVIAGYATGSVTASSNYVGGLVGFGPGATVIASYATGRVSGVSDVGGLFGYGSGTTFVASYWDTGTSGQRSGVRGENVAGAEGKTTAELQSPTGDTGIYVAWNTDLDNADVDGNPATGAEDYWDFGTSSQYPALKADIDGNGVATWQELGGQGRVPPPTPPLLPTPPPTVNGKYDGDGDRLIEVSNLEQLNAVRYDVNGDGRPDRDSDSLVYSLAFPVGGAEAVCDKRCHGYELAGPLDFGEAGSYASGAVRAGWSSGSGWEPIGVDTSGRMFSATFDGNGHTVSNLYIDRAIGSDRSSGVGLFGVAGGSSVIRGIGLVNAEVHGYYQVGGLVGKHSGTISDSYATGNVTGSDDDVGGLVGENNGQVSDSYAAGTVSGVADVGGLVGENSSQVSDSYATGGVTGSGNNVGGLVGRSAAPISDSYATGTVSGGADVGGLVGENSGQVSASYATGSVTGSGNNVGGLVGAAGSGVTFTASYATGSVTGSVGSVGGLVGNAGSGITVIAGYATGSVTASSNYVGGLVGFGPGATVIASYATGRVSGVSDVGGLFGYGSGTTFVASYWDTGTSGQRSGVRGENVAGAEGKTTAELQSPTGDTGIYVAWNTDLDNADVDGNPATGAEDYWDFGTSSQYPALKADIDGNGVATWQEFGRQRMNTPPEFPAAHTERSVPENPAEGENIGGPVVAEDAEDDTLTYALGGADAASFDIVASSGQLQTKAALDFETTFSYMVTVSVHDGHDADWNADTTSDATVTVTITVTDVDETPEVTGKAAVDYQENGAGTVAAYTATEPDNDPITWSLSGPDMGAFGIGSGGELSFNTPPDFEGPADADTDNVYEVTVEASDGGATPGTLDVTVTVANVDETPEVTGEAAVDYQENGAGTVAAYTATEPDNDPITWSLSGPDMGAFGIGSGGELSFNTPPDFEGPADADTDNVYEVTVEASDGGATPGKLDVTVTVADETPEVTLSSPNPQLGVPLIATLNDPEDGAVAGVTWQWASSSDGSTWTDIEGATHETYTPVAEDVGKYLRATAEYTDGDESLSTAQPVSDALVATNTAPEFPATETGERSVLESAPEGGNIGAPVAATDANDDTLTYTLGGADAGSFDIDGGTGQIKVGAGTTPDPAVRDTYTVVVTATDPSGASATITVTIMVTGLLKQYDSDGNGAISKNEAIAAVRDYFSGNLTKEQTIAVIRLYFVSGG